MNIIPFASESLTMSSVELLEMVNAARKQFGETDVRRNDFAARCRDELDGEHYETFVVKNPNGTESEAVRMTRDQCMYVLMRESKAVRRAVASRLKQLKRRRYRKPFRMHCALLPTWQNRNF